MSDYATYREWQIQLEWEAGLRAEECASDELLEELTDSDNLETNR